MIRRGRWKLVYQPLSDGHLLQLFDVEEDPMCRLNLIDQHADIASMLWQKLRVWVGRVSEIASENHNDEAINPRGPTVALAASDMQQNKRQNIWPE